MALTLLSQDCIKKALKKRVSDSHKGDYGRVMVVGGSTDYVGAPIMGAQAALASLRAGADVVTLLAPERVAWSANCISPDIITSKIRGDYFKSKDVNKTLELSQKFDAVVVGAGIGIKDETKHYINNIIRRLRCPFVLDADALKLAKVSRIKNCILTPHMRELEIILLNNGKKGLLRKIQNKSVESVAKVLQKRMGDFLRRDNVILLKGSVDAIISKNKIIYNKTGNPGMTVAGTGDVLAGLCAGFLAQSHDTFAAACAAAYVSGKAGDLAKKKHGDGLIASDVIEQITKVIWK
ncbi:NAD(P)H-hydrate dehydratase [Candidatus Woesearchaeota archaeon]|nr:NAD(P)H-hydrate dehydratase [Candidatus Woesearchaeota archaeon]